MTITVFDSATHCDELSVFEFMRFALSIAPVFTLIFAIIEKTNKEKFVLNYTH